VVGALVGKEDNMTLELVASVLKDFVVEIGKMAFER
jgi:hypothetical protein